MPLKKAVMELKRSRSMMRLLMGELLLLVGARRLLLILRRVRSVQTDVQEVSKDRPEGRSGKLHWDLPAHSLHFYYQTQTNHRRDQR